MNLTLNSDELFTVDPWPWQRRGVEEVISHYGRTGSVCLQSPTGGGKSKMMWALVNWAELLSLRVGVLTNRNSLCRQLHNDMNVAGIEHGVVASQMRSDFDLSKNVQLMMVQSEMAQCKRRARTEVDILIVDEAHLFQGGKTAKLVAEHKDSGTFVVSVTATPIGMASTSDEIVIAGTNSELRQFGAHVPCIVRAPSEIDCSEVRRVATGEFVVGDLIRKVWNQQIIGHVFDEWVTVNPNREPTICFGPDCGSSLWLAQQFENRGIRAAHVEASNVYFDGETRRDNDGSLREEIFRLVRSGEIEILCNRFVCREGLDFPNLRHAILATPIGSMKSYVQTCLDEETEVLTRRGWMGPDDLLDSDTVASMDKSTGDIMWGPCRAKIDHTNQHERMYAAKGPHLDIRVTENHMILHASTKGRDWNCNYAKEVSSKVRGGYCIPVSGIDRSRPGLDLTDSQIRFLGWWITDGTFNTANGQCQISQSSSPEHDWLRADIEQCMDEAGLHWRKYSYERKGVFAKYHASVHYNIPKCRVPEGKLGWLSLAEYLDKEICDKLFQMSPRQVLIFLEAINLGDGAKKRKVGYAPKTYSITKGNKRFVDRLQSLCVTSGIRCNVTTTVQDGRGWGIPGSLIYTVYACPGKTTASLGGTTTRADAGNNKTRLLAEHGPVGGERVWCVSTDYGTIVTRRNGRVAIVGNCGRLLRYSPQTPDQVYLSDHGGNARRHGSPNADRDWEKLFRMTESEVYREQKKSESDGKEKGITCPRCKVVRKSGNVCPEPPFGCGAESSDRSRFVIQGDGSLKRVAEKDMRKASKKVPDAPQKAWDKLFWSQRKGTGNLHFWQLSALFFKRMGYRPPGNLRNQPKDWQADGNTPARTIENNKLSR